MNPVQIGDMVPSFSLPDQDGKMINITDYIGRKKLVLFFYPRDGSHFCTKEACYFRDLSQTFDELNAVILGISGQSVESHRKFATQYRLDYPLLSDESNHVRKLFGVPASAFGLLDGRVTYVANHEGKIEHIFNSQLQPERHVDEALKVCLLLKRTDNEKNSRVAATFK